MSDMTGNMSASSGSEIERLQQQLNQARTRIAALEAQIASFGATAPGAVDLSVEFRQSRPGLTESVHTIREIADCLLACTDIDSLCRRAVELARDTLKLDRCGIFLAAGDRLCGTWGTDPCGKTLDQHEFSLPSAVFLDLVKSADALQESGCQIHRGGESFWAQCRGIAGKAGWVAVIPILSEDRLAGIVVVDGAIGVREPDSVQIELLEFLASLLANLIERRRIEGSRDEEGRLLRTLIDNMPDLIYAKDCDGRFILNNRSHLELLGLKSQGDALGRTAADFIQTAPLQERCEEEQQVITVGQSRINHEESCIDRSGRERQLLTTRVPIHNSAGEVSGLVGISRDVTEMIELESQLRQVEKMDAIGQLAGGIAHDFNNQLASILGFSDILTCELSGNERLRHYAELIVLASKRSSELTKQLLAFARKGKYQTEIISIHATIQEVIELLEHSFDKRISIRRIFDAVPDTVLGDPSQLQSALLNVALNARDALPNGGELTFTSTRVNLSQKLAQTLSGDVPPGKYIRIDVRDTGIGMDAHTKEHLFEPFFTTKGIGKGTGMGLASVYGTVKNHKGGIAVHSVLGKGTTFRIYLPAVDAPVAEPSEQALASPLRGNAAIMFIDDESSVCGVAKRMLSSLGYDVVVFTEPDEALRYYKTAFADLDLVIIDMMMPSLSGSETYRALRRINPAVRTILSSGYTLDGEAEGILAEGVNGFIGKPFMLDELSKIVDNVLSG